MIWIDLIYNLAILMALCVFSGFVGMRWKSQSRFGILLQGLVFGTAAVIGMLRPVHLAPGIIFDGRTVMVSLCALFFGPWATATACLIMIPVRIVLQGPGMVPGVAMIVISALIGTDFHYRYRKKPEQITAATLLMLGVASQLAMLSTLFLMPADIILPLVQRIVCPILLIYPPATVLIGKILLDQTSNALLRETRSQSEQSHRIILQTAMDGYFLVDPGGRLREVNNAYCRMSGYSEKELLALSLRDLDAVYGDADIAAYFEKVMAQGEDRLESRHRRKDGSLFDVAINVQYQPAGGGQLVVFLQDITERKRSDAALRASEARYRQILEQAPMPIAHARLDGTLDFRNARFIRLFGYTKEQVASLSDWWRLAYPDPEYREEVRQKWDQAVSEAKTGSREIKPAEFRIVCADGETRVVEIAGFLQEDGALVTFNDLTERIKAETSLQESERELREAQNMAQLGHWIWDVRTGDVEWSDEVYKIFRLDPKSFTPHIDSILALSPWPQDHERDQELIRRAVSNHEKGMYEQRFLRPDKSTGYYQSTFQGKYDEHGNLVTIIGTVQDITERKRTEEELQKIQKLQSIGTLAGGLAHDFNNILQGLFGNISLAKEELAKGHPAFTLLEEAEKSLCLAVRLTKQLLTFAKGGEPVKEDVSLGALVQEVSRFDLSGSPISLIFQQPEDPWQIKADKGQMQQVISNLVINARQAMPAGGHLYVTLENEELEAETVPGLLPGKYVKLSVKDEGTGIDPQMRDRIFDPYFTTKKDGIGLGLATVFSIVTKHAGAILVDSEPGRGSTFTLYLPAFRPAAPEAVSPPAAERLVPRTHARVLVMDDEEPVRKLAARILAADGYAVDTAESGQEAIDKSKQALRDGRPFSLVIMDMTVPGGIGGKEAVKDILALDPSIRALVSSGYSDDPVMAAPAAFGFRGAVAKPYTPQALRAIAAQALSQCR